MRTNSPLQSTSGRACHALALMALGLCLYGLGFVLGREGNQALGSHRAGVLHEQTGPALELAAPGLPSSDDSSPAALSPFFPGLTNALEAFAAGARQVDPNDKGSEGIYLLEPLLRLLSTNDYSKAWTLIMNVRPGVRWILQSDLLQLWSGLDPRAALKAVQALAPDDERNWHMLEVLSGWGEKQPQAALEWVRQTLPDDRQKDALCSVAKGLANQDAKAAARLLASLLGVGDKSGTAMDVLEKLAPLDPDAALSLLDQTGRDEDRDQGFSFIAEVRAAQSIPDTLSWAKTLSNSKDQETALRAVALRLASTEPGQAVEFLMSQPAGKQRDELAGPVTETWAASDPQAASAWASQLPDGPLRQEACAGLVRSWAPQDPEAAANFIVNSLPPGDARLSQLKDVAQAWCLVAKLDTQGPMSWAGQLPAGTDRDAFLSGMCQSLADQDPSQAAPLAATIGPGKIQAETFDQLAGKWVFSYDAAPEAGAWSAALPPGPTRAAAMAAISAEWASADPAGCGLWLGSLPADGARAKAAEAYVARSVRERPDLAAQWVDSIAEENARNEQMEAIARQWLKTDRDAAQAWLEQTALPADRQESLLEE